MALRIGINGFGRIGRLALRVMAENSDIECVGINDLMPTKTMAHLFKYDSVHGRFKGTIEVDETSITVNGKKIPITCEKDPTQLPWGKLNCDIVFECTGIFRDSTTAAKHITAGAKKVIISAPAKGDDVPTFVMGVNHEEYNPSSDIVSNASCTTNCLAPVAKVLNDNFGIEHGLMTTIHSYTNDQSVLDGPHSDLRRARTAAVSQIPTTTGAAKAAGLVLPDLKGKLDGMAVRVPTPNVSLVDLVAVLKKTATAEDINSKMKSASEGSLKGVLAYCDEPTVSVDYMSDPHSSIFDSLSTKVIGNMVKVISWYDNEYGFCNRMVDLAKYMGSKL